jgi:hypothetical protein
VSASAFDLHRESAGVGHRRLTSTGLAVPTDGCTCSLSDPLPILSFTNVYTVTIEEAYRFDERSYDALAAAGISWQVVLDVLRARPRVRQHIGAVLRIAARANDGRWIAVALIEEDDDEYLVVSARELDTAEHQAVQRMIDGGTG